jgi:hypothetical protein
LSVPQKPRWKVPKNIRKVLEDEDGMWEDDRWSPIALTLMSGTELDGRDIPVAWQIEFDPSSEALARANASLEAMEIEPDGYGWGEHIREAIQKQDAGLAERLHMNDCEIDTCVIWVETEEDCRNLVEATWALMFASRTS